MTASSDVLCHFATSVKKRASEIRTQGLQTPALFLNKCLDVDIELMSAIATWNAEVEGLRRDIAVRRT